MIASTSEVYGKQDRAPLSEDDDITFGSSGKARWSYAASKLMDEFIALGYYRSARLPVVIVRFFNIVGPRQTGEYGMVIPRFVQQALRNDNITVHGDGSQTRTFTHVNEVVECMVRLMESPAALGEVVNIGGVEEISIKELAQRIIDKSQSRSKLTFIPYDQVYTRDFEDMPRRVPSTRKLKKLIEMSPEQTLDSILEDIIEHMRMAAR